MYENRQRAQGIAALLRNFMDWIHEVRIERAKSRMLFHDIQRRAACAEFVSIPLISGHQSGLQGVQAGEDALVSIPLISGHQSGRFAPRCASPSC